MFFQRLRKSPKSGSLLNGLFKLINGLEVKLTMAGIRFPAGSSLILMATKNHA